MGCDIHMVLEKRILPEGMMPGSEIWVGVNAFPYVFGTVYDFTMRDAAAAGAKGGVRSEDVRYTFSGRMNWQATDRNYELFGALAGVRRDGPPPKGLPVDISPLAAHVVAGWGSDGHSHTWLSMEEALPLFLLHRQFGDPGAAVTEALKTGSTNVLAKYMGHFWYMEEDDDLSDFRLIVWFDN